MAFDLKTTVLAGAISLAGAVSTSAAVIDFTDDTVGLTGSVFSGITYTVTSSGPVRRNETGPGSLNGLVGDNDGIGIRNDEITFPSEWVTVTFSSPVTLIGAAFLDLFLRSGAGIGESANITNGAVVGASDASVEATLTRNQNTFGYGELTGLTLRGTDFTFWAGPGRDDNTGDFALASLNVAPIPLPAGALLFGTALAGFGLMRRRKTA